MMVSVSGRVNIQTMMQRQQGIKEIFLRRYLLRVQTMIWTWDFICLHGIFMNHLTDIMIRMVNRQPRKMTIWITTNTIIIS